jgi:hypothetical protein
MLFQATWTVGALFVISVAATARTALRIALQRILVSKSVRDGDQAANVITPKSLL